MIPPREADRVVPLASTLARSVHAWAIGRALAGDPIAIERLGAVVGAGLVEELLEYARDVALARGRPSDPGNDPPPSAA